MRGEAGRGAGGRSASADGDAVAGGLGRRGGAGAAEDQTPATLDLLGGGGLVGPGARPDDLLDRAVGALDGLELQLGGPPGVAVVAAVVPARALELGGHRDLRALADRLWRGVELHDPRLTAHR